MIFNFDDFFLNEFSGKQRHQQQQQRQKKTYFKIFFTRYSRWAFTYFEVFLFITIFPPKSVSKIPRNDVIFHSSISFRMLTRNDVISWERHPEISVAYFLRNLFRFCSTFAVLIKLHQ